MDAEPANAFVEVWLAAWDSHDVDRVLAHDAEDVVFEPPASCIASTSRRATYAARTRCVRAGWLVGCHPRPRRLIGALAPVTGPRLGPPPTTRGLARQS